MSISSSIVLYNNSQEDINNVLQSLVQIRVQKKIYIVDNSPGQVNFNLDPLPELEYIKTPRNIGFGPAHNLALQKALDMGAKYHLVLNPDLDFSSSVIDELYSYMEANPDVGNVMPMVCYPDGSNQYLAKLMPTPGKLLVRLFHRFLPASLVQNVNKAYELHDLCLDRPVQVPAVSGCFMFLRLEALRWAGLFDERYFLYFEDFDLVRRIGLKYKIIYHPQVAIYHDFARASRRNWAAFAAHVASAVKYFNKWGWLEDKYRQDVNKKTMLQLARDSSYNQEIQAQNQQAAKQVESNI